MEPQYTPDFREKICRGMEMIKLTKGEQSVEKDTPLAYLIFLLISYVLTGILLLLLAFLLYRFQLSGKAVAAGVIVIYIVSTFVGGFLAGKKAKNKKYLWGLLMGTCYFVILAALSFLTNSASGGVGFLTSFLLCAGGGMLGGMLS